MYKRTQYYSSKDLKDFQKKKLEAILEHAIINVPFYKTFNLSKSTDVFECLKTFPIIDKNIIRDNFKNFTALGINPKLVIPNSTSGSTGQNFKFLSHKNSHGQALQIRQDEWVGKKLFEKEIKIWGSTFDLKKSGKLIPKIKQKFKRTIILSGYNLSDEKIAEYIKTINKVKPKLLHSYPSILYLLAIHIEKNHIEMAQMNIKSAGEKLFPFQRDKIESVFKTKIFDFYGARDIPMVAHECEQHQGLHVMMENVYLEVLDQNDQPIEEGEGDLVLTDLNNFAMPFIRYRIGDRAQISKRNCACGRGLTLIEEVIGRTFEIIQFPNGNRVGGTFWTFVLKSVPGILDFQVIQQNQFQIDINYICDEKFNPSNIDFKTILKHINEYSGTELNIYFKEVETIEPTKGGKHLFVITKIKKL
ncbi:MAG: hypothetical protein WCP69_12880 [Bacteroidota bacterium]